MLLKLSKYHVAGNNFILVAANERNEHDWVSLSVSLCRHKYGVGSDGLLVVVWNGAEGYDFEMRMFNPDGTEDGCGNGLLCATRFAYESMLLKFGNSPLSFTVKTIWGASTVRVINSNPKDFVVEAELVEPKWEPSEIPMKTCETLTSMTKEPREVVIDILGMCLRCIPVNTGSTHVVIFSDKNFDDEVWEKVSAAIENHTLFPQRTSVMWAWVINQSEVRVRSYERAVGETLSCGTGACAVVAAGLKLGLLKGIVKVVFKGGSVYVFMDETGKLHIRGQVHHVFDATLRRVMNAKHNAAFNDHHLSEAARSNA
ncbi:MAG: diaminopimelate epimerase [Armatimonadota bacterium]|nr:diaminopimelate epimerase [Armatimonadota bacterium]MDW8026373.1 diaminopimelate epimerase [Armatimonadota bacterium]